MFRSHDAGQLGAEVGVIYCRAIKFTNSWTCEAGLMDGSIKHLTVETTFHLLFQIHTLLGFASIKSTISPPNLNELIIITS